MPDTWELIQRRLARLNKHGIPVELAKVYVRREIADNEGHFNRDTELEHMDPLNVLLNLTRRGSVAYSTRFYLGDRTMTPQGSTGGAYLNIDRPVSSSFGRRAQKGEFISQAGLAY